MVARVKPDLVDYWMNSSTFIQVVIHTFSYGKSFWSHVTFLRYACLCGHSIY